MELKNACDDKKEKSNIAEHIKTKEYNHIKSTVYFVQNDHSFYENKRNHRTPNTSERSCSEPLAEVQGALLVVLVLHAPHPEAGGLLGLRKLREHSEKSAASSEN